MSPITLVNSNMSVLCFEMQSYIQKGYTLNQTTLPYAGVFYFEIVLDPPIDGVLSPSSDIVKPITKSAAKKTTGKPISKPAKPRTPAAKLIRDAIEKALK